LKNTQEAKKNGDALTDVWNDLTENGVIAVEEDPYVTYKNTWKPFGGC
jgi:hypothetical protein